MSSNTDISALYREFTDAPDEMPKFVSTKKLMLLRRPVVGRYLVNCRREPTRTPRSFAQSYGRVRQS